MQSKMTSDSDKRWNWVGGGGRSVDVLRQPTEALAVALALQHRAHEQLQRPPRQLRARHLALRSGQTLGFFEGEWRHEENVQWRIFRATALHHKVICDTDCYMLYINWINIISSVVSKVARATGESLCFYVAGFYKLW